MALKEKALKRLCGKLSKTGLPFSLTGDWMLSVRGFDVPWHTFDVFVPLSAFQEADAVLSRLGMRSPVLDTDSFKEIHYHFDGADIALRSGSVRPEISYLPPYVTENVTVLGENVPLMTLEDAFVLAVLAGDTQQIDRLRTCLLTHPFSLARLSSSLAKEQILSQVPMGS